MLNELMIEKNSSVLDVFDAEVVENQKGSRCHRRLSSKWHLKEKERCCKIPRVDQRGQKCCDCDRRGSTSGSESHQRYQGQGQLQAEVLFRQPRPGVLEPPVVGGHVE